MTDDHSAGIDKEPLRPGQHSALSTIMTVLLALIILWLFINVLLRPGPGLREKAREAESKANLHNIQLSIERYAVDHGGEYPAYLIGGEPKYAAKVDVVQGSRADTFKDVANCDVTQVSDPLLRAGYIDAYPRNPFFRDSLAIHTMQESLPTSFCGNDPLRNGAAEAAVYGTRFGPYCTTMGQVLCDPRYPQWEYRDPATGASELRDTWATIEYRMWDMWRDGRGKEPYLAIAPGQFFYKSTGWNFGQAVKAGQLDKALPDHVAAYVLGVYGGLKTKGKDALGEEQPMTWCIDQGAGRTKPLRLWLWTRSQLSATEKQGSPYSIEWTNIIADGNPNGIPDGIVLMLAGGYLPGEG